MEARERRRQATEKAAEFLVMLEEPSLSRQEREQIVDWLRESPIHVAEMLSVAQVSGSLAQFQPWADIAGGAEEGTQSNVVSLPLESKRHATAPVRSRRSWLGTAAAGFVALACIATWLYLTPRERTIETARGERREISLADGTALDLDPETRLRVRYSVDQRDVFLDSGRAFFRVAKDSRRTFIVHSEGALVRAVGTAFGVERAGDSLVVTVSEGKVSVASAQWQAIDRSHSSAPASTLPAQAGAAAVTPQVFLKAGEQIVVPRFGHTQAVRHVDSSRELAWAEGRLIFDNEPISSVIERFNRYNHVQLHVDDPGLAQRPISGVFTASDPDSFIAFLQNVISVHAVRDGTQDITLTPGSDANP
jgi:transmembrane sensor